MKYQCDSCYKDFEFSDDCYLGSDDESCSEFTRLTCLCAECYDKKGKTVVDTK